MNPTRLAAAAALALAAAASLALAAGHALAAPAPLPAPEPRTVVVRAARAYDGRADRVTSPGLVVVRGDRIVASGPGAAIPAGAETVDLGDATLMPGLIDAHTHLMFEMTTDWKQDQLAMLKKPIPQLALEAAVFARRTLEAGVTTVRDVGSGYLVDVGLRNAIAEGAVPGPRMLVAVNMIGATGGHCDVTGYRPGALGKDAWDGVADGADAVRAMVRRQVKLGADVIKICASGGVGSEGDAVDAPQMTVAEMEAAVDEARALDKKVAAHCHGATAAKRAVKAGVDSIEHGTFLDDEALDLMKARGTTLVPTLSPVASIQRLFEESGAPASVVEKAHRASAALQKTFHRAVAKGVRIGFGTDAGVARHGENARELGLMVKAGMRPVDALRAATGGNAELLGTADRGTLEAGRLADVIAVPGDPTRDVSAVERVFFVMKGGAVARHDGAPRPGPVAADVSGAAARP